MEIMFNNYVSKIPFDHFLNVGRPVVDLYLHLAFLLLVFLGILVASNLSFWHGPKSSGDGPIFGPPRAPRIESEKPKSRASSNELDPMVQWLRIDMVNTPQTARKPKAELCTAVFDQSWRQHLWRKLGAKG